ncbi:hypothetical protein CASFOL_039906 [Castilleja foliolosa]|uniref:Peptidase A1 domain-containing protein n=1 Tax=Castilleja foliolosa TaxID=1961234 RepID=A0ABD3BHD7_9LAMI
MMETMLYSYLLLILFSYFSEKSVALQTHFENVEPASKCKRFFTDPKNMPNSTFEVFDMYGPCSPTAGTSPMKMPSPHDILRLDQLRVKALQARFKNDSRFQDTKEVENLPVEFSYTNHAISIILGNPQQVQTFTFDTASGITWTNGFHPFASHSREIISCASPLCSFYLPSHTCETFENFENTCFFNIEYVDGTNVKGAIIIDTLTIPQTGHMFTFLFGCPTDVNSRFSPETNGIGILGLGRGHISFMSQTWGFYMGVFSYCFPSSPSSTGFLKLGPIISPNNVRFTPLIAIPNQPSLYFIKITSISVGDVELSINLFDFMYPGTMSIDTNTVVTRLPSNVYTTMRDEFRNHVEYYGYRTVPSPHYLLDTCYSDIQGFFVPTITFTFEGDVSVVMDSSSTLFTMEDWEVSCLAFAGNSEHDQPSIFGNIQQKKLEVVYDVANGILGFSQNGCD